MAPEFISSSYRQYKDDTAAFTTWLGRAATLCGYKTKAGKKPLATSGDNSAAPKQAASTRDDAGNGDCSLPKTTSRLKGKARKLAKEAEAARTAAAAAKDQAEAGPATITYAVSTLELTEQIERVEQARPAVRMPSAIRKILERAIQARERCADWFEKAEVDVAFDRGGHRHFIKVLRNGLLRLSPQPLQTENIQPTAAPANNGSGRLDDSQFTNRFDCLELHDIDESVHLTAADVALSTTGRAGATKNKTASVKVFELEAEKAFDDAFALFCFFEDLHRFREGVTEVWNNVNSGKTGVVAATAATHTAIAMISRAERAICAKVAPSEPGDDCYVGLAAKLVAAEVLTKGMAGKLPGGGNVGVEVTPLDDFIFMPAARTLAKFVWVSSMLKSSDQTEARPPPVPALKFKPTTEPQTAKQKLQQILERKKMLWDDRLLTQYLLDIQFMDRFEQEKSETRDSRVWPLPFGLLQEDAVIQALKPVCAKKKISVTSVVAAQIWLDIIRICDAGETLLKFPAQLYEANDYVLGEVECKSAEGAEGSDPQVSIGNLEYDTRHKLPIIRLYLLTQQIRFPVFYMTKAITDDYCEKHRDCKYDWCRTPSDMRMRLTDLVPSEIRNLVPNFGQSPLLVTYAGGHGATVGDGQRSSIISFDSQEDSPSANSPLAAGSTILRLLLDYHDVGLRLANQYTSFFALAHVYNAARQLKLLDLEWPAMERLIQLHRRSMFADVLPTTAAEMAQRINYRLNLLASPRDHLYDKTTFKAPASLLALRQLVSSPIWDERALWFVEQHLVTASGLLSSATGAGKQHGQQQQIPTASTTGTCSLSPDKLVPAFADAVNGMCPDIAIDYIKLTRHCQKLLLEFRDEWLREAEASPERPFFPGRRHPPVTESGVKLHVNLFYICWETLTETEYFRNSGEFTYAPGDGGSSGSRGTVHREPGHPDRHGTGLRIAAGVLRKFLTDDDDHDDDDDDEAAREAEFPLPPVSDDRSVRTCFDEVCDGPGFGEVKALVDYVDKESQFKRLRLATTYLVVVFQSGCTKYVAKLPAMKALEARAVDFVVPGVLGFAWTHKFLVPESYAKYCGGGAAESCCSSSSSSTTSAPHEEAEHSEVTHSATFVFFKDGEQIEVNGNMRIHSSDAEGLTQALETLGELARKIEEEA